MLDINILRSNPSLIQENLKKRDFLFDVEVFNKLDAERKKNQIDTESLQEKSNKIAKEIASEKDPDLKKNKLKIK